MGVEMITYTKKDGIIYYKITDENILFFIEAEPTATTVQRIYAEKFGSYDTSGLVAFRVDKNKWAVLKLEDLK